MADLFLFILAEGADVRDRLKDGQFRQRLAKRWDTLGVLTRELRKAEDARIRGEGRRADPAELPGLGDLAALPGLWEFLDRPDAARLFARYGPLAIDICHARADDPTRRDRAAKLLSDGGERVALLLAARVPHWRVALNPFLDDKEVSADLLARVAHDVDERPTEADRLLRLTQLGEVLKAKGKTGLAGALGRDAGVGLVGYLPGYALYRVYTKYDTGDEITDTDLLFAGLDMLTLAPGVGIVTTLGKTGGKAVTKEAGKEAVRKVAVEAGKVAGRRLGKHALKDAGDAAGSKAALWLGVRAGYQQVHAAVTKAFKFLVLDRPKALVVRLEQIDITRVVQFAYARSHLGRETFKRLVGLEARVFMRADARVFLQFRYTLSGAKIHAWVAAAFAREVEHWAQVDDVLSPDLLAALPPPARWAEPDRWKHAAGVLFLMAAADLLPNP